MLDNSPHNLNVQQHKIIGDETVNMVSPATTWLFLPLDVVAVAPIH